MPPEAAGGRAPVTKGGIVVDGGGDEVLRGAPSLIRCRRKPWWHVRKRYFVSFSADPIVRQHLCRARRQCQTAAVARLLESFSCVSGGFHSGTPSWVPVVGRSGCDQLIGSASISIVLAVGAPPPAHDSRTPVVHDEPEVMIPIGGDRPSTPSRQRLMQTAPPLPSDIYCWPVSTDECALRWRRRRSTSSTAHIRNCSCRRACPLRAPADSRVSSRPSVLDSRSWCSRCTPRDNVHCVTSCSQQLVLVLASFHDTTPHCLS